jgi:hypothetical protein
MTMLEQRPVDLGDEPHRSPEVIIPEARKREKRRRSLIGLVIALVLASGLGIGIGFGGGQGAGHGQGSVSGAGGVGAAHGPTPPSHSVLADVGTTPAGWAAVPLTGIQVSVPASWQVEPPGETVCGRSEGVVLLGQGLHPRELGCTRPFAVANVVSLRATNGPAPSSGKQVLIHGLKVTLTSDHRTETEFARVTGMTIAAKGPLATTIVRTITHSPRSVVLGPYRVSVPRAWRHLAFGGLSFSVPKRWTTEKVAWIGGCPINIARSTLVDSTARSVSLPSCMPPSSTAGYMAARPGMKVFAGPKVPAVRAQLHGTECRSLNGLRVCVQPCRIGGGYSATNYPGLLTADVYIPGRTRPDLVEIGLSGTGMTPLRIFDSLQPSR